MIMDVANLARREKITPAMARLVPVWHCVSGRK
jgi:hypothetical protein